MPQAWAMRHDAGMGKHPAIAIGELRLSQEDDGELTLTHAAIKPKISIPRRALHSWLMRFVRETLTEQPIESEDHS